MTQKSRPCLKPRLEFLPSPSVHSDLAAASAVAAADEPGATPVIEISFGEGEGFLNAQAGPLQDHDQAAQPAPVHTVTVARITAMVSSPRRIGRVAQALVAWRATA